MKAVLYAIAAALSAGLAQPGAAAASGIDAQLSRYAAQARAADAGFTGFSVERGAQLHTQRFAGGKPDTPACTSCHGEDPTKAGKTRTGKAIAPMALSVSPDRYADEAKVEKWFGRNCREVMGRECTPLEKGDWLSFMRAR